MQMALTSNPDSSIASVNDDCTMNEVLNSDSLIGAPQATTTRDLADAVDKGALIRAGERKHARYTLDLANH